MTPTIKLHKMWIVESEFLSENEELRSMDTNGKEENMRSEKFVQKLPPHLDKKLADLVKEIEGVR